MRILLVQPDDDMALDLLEEFEGQGDMAFRVSEDTPDAVRDAAPQRPEALIVMLDADPDAALALATLLGARRRLRGVPFLFVGGTQAAINAAQEAFPRASFARRDVLHNALASLRS